MAIDAVTTLKEWREQAVGEGLIQANELDDERLITMVRGLFEEGQLQRVQNRLGLAERTDLVFSSAWRHLAAQSEQGFTVASMPKQLQPLNGQSVEDVASNAGAPSAGGAPGAPASGGLASGGPAPSSDAVEDHSWARYDGAPPVRRSNLMVRLDGDNALVSWHPVGEDQVRLFRVVFRDDYSPFDPDNGKTAIVTKATTSTIEPPTHYGIRYVTVWQHSGADEASARAAEPVCIADREIVAVPRGIRVMQDSDRAICRWQLPARAVEQHVLKAVDITRFDEAEYDAGGADGFGGTRISAGAANIGGFIDYDIEPGGRYVYRVCVRAQSDLDEVIGEPIYVRFATESPLEPVEDLEVSDADESGSRDVDLVWSAPPSGEVIIYRTDTMPEAGFDHQAISIDRLEQIGLDPSSQLPNPVDFLDDGRRTMRRVGRPRGWHMVFFTPVTVTDRDARLGKTVNGEPETKPPTNFSIVERVSEQILRFGWPAGATEVEIRLGPLRSSEEDVLSRNPSARLTADEYAMRGGYAMNLPWQGARVVITSSRSYGGQSFGGGSVSAMYPGMLPVRYSINRKGGLLGAPTLQVSVWTESGRDNGGNPVVKTSPSFVLVHHPSRLPLSANEPDSTVLPVSLADTTADPLARFAPSTLYNGPGVEQWEAVLKDKHVRKGFYRLFISQDGAAPSRFALLDPPLKSLKA